MQTLTRSTAALALAAAIATPLHAQECTATITPAQVQAGQQAVRLNVRFSEDVGDLTRLQAADSGISVAEASDLPRTDLAANAPAPRPIAMAEGQQNTWTVYVNTEDARPGSHRITFVGDEGGCTAQLTVQGAQGGAQPGAQPRPGAQPGQPSGGAQPGAQPRPGAQPGQPSGGAQPGAQPGSPSGGAQPGAQPRPGSQPGAQPGSPSGGAQPGARPNN